MSEIFIDSPDDPRLEPFRHLKQTNLTRWSGRFIAEGEKVVRRLLESPYTVESVLLAENRRSLLAEDGYAQANVLVVSQSVAKQLIGFQFHAGVLACGLRHSAPELARLPVSIQEPSLLVACEQLTDPDNLGTLIRLCTAFGVQGLILGPRCADPFSRRTLRVSMGNAFALPIALTDDLWATLAILRQQGHTLLATMLHPSATPLQKVLHPGRCVVLFGNEAHGLDPRWLRECDQVVVIPMHGGTDSLNVSIAAGIVLNHLQTHLPVK